MAYIANGYYDRFLPPSFWNFFGGLVWNQTGSQSLQDQMILLKFVTVDVGNMDWIHNFTAANNITNLSQIWVQN
jgi:hypothetical protein